MTSGLPCKRLRGCFWTFEGSECSETFVSEALCLRWLEKVQVFEARHARASIYANCGIHSLTIYWPEFFLAWRSVLWSFGIEENYTFNDMILLCNSLVAIVPFLKFSLPSMNIVITLITLYLYLFHLLRKRMHQLTDLEEWAIHFSCQG